MKIAISNVTATFVNGGSENYAWSLARFLTQRGHDVDLIAGEVADPVVKYDDVRLVMRPFTPRRRLPNLGTRFRKLGERLSFGLHCRELFRTGRYDVLNIHKPYDIPAALWARRQSGCATVWRCHGTDFYPGMGTLAAQLDAIYCNSRYTRQILTDPYPMLRPELIYTGVDTSFWSPQPMTKENPPLILYFGRLAGWKGVNYLVEALAALTGKAWRAEIIGDGDARPALQQQMANAGLNERLALLPAIRDRSRLRQHIAAASVVVFPSLEDETFSNALLEAMGVGSPIVATGAGGNLEAIEHEKHGLLVPTRDPQALAQAIARLLDDTPLAAELGRSARERVCSEFDSEHSFVQVERLFERMAQVRSRAG